MTLENRVGQVETDLEDVRILLGSAARYAENATAIAERNAIAVADQRLDIDRLIVNSETTHQRLDETNRQMAQTNQQLGGTNHQMAQTSQRLDETNHQMAQTSQRLDATNRQMAQTGQRLDEFIFQSQRILSNHGERLSRVEAALETLVNLSQSHERRLTGRESKLLEVEDRLDRIEGSVEGLSNEVRSLTAAIDRLETIVERHISNHG
ncbi:hypothetical protein PN498_17520 [Oscillatoria sp. CS-180]|uniref:hypothetical protein n=1 Tax=Oscillatoria sp. CS-180 TaxID=3021720 RepID=UPI00232BDA60|nr:hypothetical protein [Oscillatoria sp. CS-180]MDB9527799.1 hypothetical protein [Oscillatoria sp. CS-180]